MKVVTLFLSDVARDAPKNLAFWLFYEIIIFWIVQADKLFELYCYYNPTPCQRNCWDLRSNTCCRILSEEPYQTRLCSAPDSFCWTIMLLVANEVLFLCERGGWAFVTSETRPAAPRFMVILDMRIKLSFICGPWPIATIRRVWALLRFLVSLQMPAKNLLESRTWTDMSRSNKL
jgi:hypothetical protein